MVKKKTQLKSAKVSFDVQQLSIMQVGIEKNTGKKKSKENSLDEIFALPGRIEIVTYKAFRTD